LFDKFGGAVALVVEPGDGEPLRARGTERPVEEGELVALDLGALAGERGDGAERRPVDEGEGRALTRRGGRRGRGPPSASPEAIGERGEVSSSSSTSTASTASAPAGADALL
jgi:hypothetical protein